MNLLTPTQAQIIDIGLAIFIFFVTAFLGRWAIKFFFSRVLLRFTRHTKTTLDDALLEAIAPPFYWLSLVFAFKLSLNRLEFLFTKTAFNLDSFYFILFWLIGSVVAWRLIANINICYPQMAITYKKE